jgi:hypothetical protein
MQREYVPDIASSYDLRKVVWARSAPLQARADPRALALAGGVV